MKDAQISYIVLQSLRQLDNIYEVRLLGWVIAKAQAALKRYNKDLSHINMEHALNLVRVTLPARYLLQIGDTNYKNIPKAFTLAQKTVDYWRDGHLYKLNIIAFPEYVEKGRERYITFVIHNQLWNALLDLSQGWRLVNLPAYMRLQSTYSVIMFVIISQQTAPFTYHIDTIKRLLGADRQKAYQRTSNFIAKVINSAQKELNDYAPFTFTYTLERKGRGGGYENITITPIVNKNMKPFRNESAKEKLLDAQRIRLNDEVVTYLQNAWQLDNAAIERIENIIEQWGDYDVQIRRLAEIKETADRTRPANYAGYLMNALKNYK